MSVDLNGSDQTIDSYVNSDCVQIFSSCSITELRGDASLFAVRKLIDADVHYHGYSEYQFIDDSLRFSALDLRCVITR